MAIEITVTVPNCLAMLAMRSIVRRTRNAAWRLYAHALSTAAAFGGRAAADRHQRLNIM